MKNRVHVTFDTPEAADKLIELLSSKRFLRDVIGIDANVTIKPHVEVEGFTNVHDLHSLSITTK